MAGQRSSLNLALPPFLFPQKNKPHASRYHGSFSSLEPS